MRQVGDHAAIDCRKKAGHEALQGPASWPWPRATDSAAATASIKKEVAKIRTRHLRIVLESYG